jgi:hypothetical protein
VRDVAGQIPPRGMVLGRRVGVKTHRFAARAGTGNPRRPVSNLKSAALAALLLLTGCATDPTVHRSRPPRDNRDVPAWAIPDLQFPDLSDSLCDGS